MAANYCPHCGEQVEGSASYCPHCGGGLDPDMDEHTVTTPQARKDGLSIESDADTTIAAVTHIVALFTWIIGPIIILVASDDEFVVENARNALNWQIILTVYLLISAILIIVLIGAFLLFIFAILDMIFCIIAAVKAADGEAWKYPITPDIV